MFEEKDLRVTFESDLKFDEHISAKVGKANATVGLIRRTFSFLDCRMFKKLVHDFCATPPRVCVTLVFETFPGSYTWSRLVHLEYAQAVWSPRLKKNINILENV